MAKYRCPTCGAPHKEMVEHCRQCGAGMDQESRILASNTRTDQTMAADRFRARGIGHFAIWGLVAIAIVLLGAVALGVGRDDENVRWIRDNVPFLEANPDDGWVTFADPDGVLVVDVPGEVVDDEGTFAVEGTTTYSRVVGDQLVVTVGYTEGWGAPTDFTTEENFRVLDAAAEEWAAAQGAEVISDNEIIGHDGHPALDVRLDGLSLPDGAAFGSVRLIRVDDEIVFVQSVSYDTSPDAHGQMRSSLVLGVDQVADEG